MVSFDFDEKCYGCSSCANICPKGAIKMVYNKQGFLIPNIDKSKCINCNLCNKVCPRIQNIIKEKNRPLKSIFIYRNKKNDNKLKQSTSSGISYELAKYIITNNGYACGCIWDNMVAKHIVTNKLSELEKMKGTKYVQSDTKYIYRDVEKLAKEKRKVIFFGTACQIVGLRNYLKKDYENIYYIQIICHSVASPMVFEKYKNYIEKKYSKKVANMNFRYKGKGGWLTPNSLYTFEDNTSIKLVTDPYFVGFGKGLFDRKSCAKCNFKNNFDISDIIVGDAWGIGSKDFLKSKNKGASSVLINTEKGLSLFDCISVLYKIREVSFESIIQENPAIIKSYEANKNRDVYVNKILSQDEFPINEILGKRHKIKKLFYKIGILSLVKKIRYLIKHR